MRRVEKAVPLKDLRDAVTPPALPRAKQAMAWRLFVIEGVIVLLHLLPWGGRWLRLALGWMLLVQLWALFIVGARFAWLAGRGFDVRELQLGDWIAARLGGESGGEETHRGALHLVAPEAGGVWQVRAQGAYAPEPYHGTQAELSLPLATFVDLLRAETARARAAAARVALALGALFLLTLLVYLA